MFKDKQMKTGKLLRMIFLCVKISQKFLFIWKSKTEKGEKNCKTTIIL